MLLNNIVMWIFTVICIYCIYKPDKLNSQLEISNRLYNTLLIIIGIVAVFIRVYKFGSVPGGFNQDGAMAAVDGKALADYGTDRYGMFMPVHLTAWGFGQMSSLLSYMIAGFVKFFGLSPITARLPQLIVSLASIVCIYLFVRDTFDKNAALVAAAFAAINPWHIMQSRWALDCNLYPHFAMFGVYFLNRSIDNKKTLPLILSMVFFGLSMYCYGVSVYTMPLFLLMASVYLLYTKKITAGKVAIAFSVYMVIALPFLLTMAINFLKLDTIETPLFTIPFFKNSVRSNDILFFSQNFQEQLSKNCTALLNTTLLQKRDLLWNSIEEFGTMYLFSMPFTLFGLYTIVKGCKKSHGKMLVLFFLITGIWCGIITKTVNVNRINIIYIPIMILTSVGIYKLLTLKYIKYFVLATYLVAFAMFSTTYFTSYADKIEDAFFIDFASAVTAVKDSDADKLYITADSQYKGASNVSEILTLFYHNTDAKYYQSDAFKDKYTFKSIKDLNINPSEDAEYVITKDDLIYFDRNLFDFQQYGNYYTVKPK